jgi:hypothetical protein
MKANKFFMVNNSPRNITDDIWDTLQFLDEDQVKEAFERAGLIKEISEDEFYFLISLDEEHDDFDFDDEIEEELEEITRIEREIYG